MRDALRRIGDALLWAVLAAVLAPIAFSAGIALLTLARSPHAPVLGVLFYFLSFSLFASVMFVLPPYALLLLGWSALACRFAAAETRAGVVVATALLALPAGVAITFANDGPPVQLFAMFWLPAWIGLLVPRLVVPRLAPGAFARDHAPPHLLPSDA